MGLYRTVKDGDPRLELAVFGEEMAPVNFLPLEQRKQYLYDVLDHARRPGVKSDKPQTA